MATDAVNIIRIDTGEAVKSVNDLKENVVLLKAKLGDLEVGTEEYQDTLKDLKVNQNAIKDAMYATSSSMEDVAKAAKGADTTYNGLVHRMADLKAQLRSTDISTKEGKQQFANLSAQINDVNDKLKAMDAAQGNFQRNVGNYQSAFKGLGEKVDAFAKGLEATKGGANKAKGALDAMSKTPALAITGLLVSAVSKLVASFKESEEGTKQMEAAMVTLEPVMNLLKGILQKVTDVVGDLITKAGSFLGSNGLIDKLINGVVGIGNAVLKFVVAPFKAVAAAIKVFQDEGIKGIGNATKAFANEMKEGLSFKSNFEAGEAVVTGLTKGIKNKKPEVDKATQDLFKSMHKSIYKEMSQMLAQLDKELDEDIARLQKEEDDANKLAASMADARLRYMDKAAKHQLELNDILTEDDREKAAEAYDIQLQANRRRLAALQQFSDEALERGDMDNYLKYEEQVADLEVEIETNALKERKRLRQLDIQDAEEKAKQQVAIMQGLAANTSAVLGSIADLYEADEKNAEKNAEKVKALRIASATIDTISGAIGAFMQAVQTTPPPMGAILGGLQAAAVTAAGIAQIAQIRSTKVTGATASAGATPSMSATTSAPSLTLSVPEVRSITSASEEERLNAMASEQRVVLVMSDLEKKQGQVKVQTEETTF